MTEKYAAVRARLEKLRGCPVGRLPFSQDLVETLLGLVDVVQGDISSMVERVHQIEGQRLPALEEMVEQCRVTVRSTTPPPKSIAQYLNRKHREKTVKP